MSFYQIDYNQKAVELMPPDKRMVSHTAWMKALLMQLQYNVTSLFVDYKTGADYPVYVTGSYNKFGRVIYGQSVFESLSDGNTALPTDASYWRVYQLYFTGTDTRIKYNAQTLVLEYALNTRFQSSFRQPPLQSDIYITVNEPPNRVFQVGADERLSSNVGYTISSEHVVNSYTFTEFYNMVVNVPIAVYDGLSSDAAARTPILRYFIDKYIPAGIIYEIQTY